MSVLLRVAIGVILGGVLGFALEKLVARPIVQSMIAMPVGWALGSFAAAVVWLTRPSPGGSDVRAISGGLAEVALSLLIILGLSATIHAALGWAGTSLHPALSTHRAMVLGILGAVCGTISFRIVAGAV